MLVVAIFGRGIDKRGPYSITSPGIVQILQDLKTFERLNLQKAWAYKKHWNPYANHLMPAPKEQIPGSQKCKVYHHISVYLIMARHTIEIAFHRHFSQHEILLSNGCFETEVLNSKSVFHIHVFHWKEPWQAINSLS